MMGTKVIRSIEEWRKEYGIQSPIAEPSKGTETLSLAEKTLAQVRQDLAKAQG